MTLIETLIIVAIIASFVAALAGFSLLVLASYVLLAIFGWVSSFLRPEPTCECGAKLSLEVTPKTESGPFRLQYLCPTCGDSLREDWSPDVQTLVDDHGTIRWARHAGRWTDHSVF